MSGSARSDLESRRALGQLDGELARVGRHHLADRADPVAAVEVLDVVEGLLAERVARGQQLQLAGLIPQRGEDHAAVAADEHEPPGDPHLRPGVRASAPSSPYSRR